MVENKWIRIIKKNNVGTYLIDETNISFIEITQGVRIDNNEQYEQIGINFKHDMGYYYCIYIYDNELEDFGALKNYFLNKFPCGIEFK